MKMHLQKTIAASLVITNLALSACNAQSTDQRASINSYKPFSVEAQNPFTPESYLTTQPEGSFLISSQDTRPPILLSSKDYSGVNKVAGHFRADLELVTGQKHNILKDTLPGDKQIILIGTLGKNELINALVKSGKIDISELTGKWEKHLIITVENPFPQVERAIVIVGSDKRGTIYGIFDLSESLGVSPWYWWADVPVQKRNEVYLKPGTYTRGEPKVKYRGIFINDEAPALSGWAGEKFGGLNHQFYQKVFELILRLKGNFLWPAMWGRSVYDDDPKSPELADEYGVVLGTSHHEPLSRAHTEWGRYGKGDWNYATNEQQLKAFWKEGIERMGDNESLVTVGMRGDGDEAMSEGADIALLERIVKDQRDIIEEVTGKPADQTPQVWALYKEVQEYYDKGMRVPDDVTLLLCDDNWGNIRKLPKRGDTLRTGGYGIYYHFDYVGDPRNYKWINTNQISRVWEQMHLAYEYGVKQLWIVNVGDIKPMEFPTDFFLDYAWDPDALTMDNIPGYGLQWAQQLFGTAYAQEIADILEAYTRFNSRRKPELLSPETYNLTNFSEWKQIVEAYQNIAEKAEQIGKNLPEEYQSAYFQLVLHPVLASSNLNELYYSTAKNRYFAKQKWKGTNELADKVKELFKKDEELTIRYHTINNGKWNHQMDQTHIGYTYWQQPDKNNLPEVVYLDEKDLTKGDLPANFYEGSYVSMEGQNYTIAVESQGINWITIPQIGRTQSGVTAFPVTALPIENPGKSSPHLEYEVNLTKGGKVTVKCYLSPTLNFHNDEGLEFALSFDDGPLTRVNLHEGANHQDWQRWVSNNINLQTATFDLKKAGKHTLKFWMIDPGVVLQKIVIETDQVGETYLGPPANPDLPVK